MKEAKFWEGVGLSRQKLDQLKTIIRTYEKVLVAFSGGSDSAFVLKVAREVLGKDNVLAVIAKSPSLPESELKRARQTALEADAPLIEIETGELENPDYASNPVNRCYFCKSELYSHLVPMAKKMGFHFVLNGTNRDDLGDWRPGLKAAQDQGVRSPLVEAGLTKEDVRAAAHELGLSTWSKPQAACLSSRIPFGTRITADRLRQIEEGEEILKGLGFEVVRLRWFEKRAAIEVGAEETRIFFQDALIREKTIAGLKGIGFQTIDLYLAGYRSGRFNPVKSISRSLRPANEILRASR